MSYTIYPLMNTEIISGTSAMAALPAKLKEIQLEKPLIVTDQNLIKCEAFKTLISILDSAQINYVVFSDVETDPSDCTVKKGVNILKDSLCDCVITVGGGSTMDCGKGISIMSVHDGNIIQYGKSTPSHLNFRQAGCPIIAIPTTSGTGSEVSRYAIITNHETHQKRSIGSGYLLSSVVILDPQFVVSMPKHITAYTGIDALCHAIEAYTHKTTIDHQVELSDGMALHAIRLISENLYEACHHPHNLTARTGMQWGALLAGVALNIGASESHGIGTYLSKYHNVPHGESVGIPLPYTMQHNIPYCPERFCRIAEAMGKDISGLDAKEGAMLAPLAVKELLESLDFPTLSDYCSSFAEIDAWCEEACQNSCCTSNGRLITADAMKTVMKKCYNQEL